METQIDNQQANQYTSAAHTLHSDLVQNPARYSSTTLDLLITAGLLIIALIPRLMLAQQLDVVTDEVVYIFGGKNDFHLLTHWLIGNSGWDYNYEHPPLVKLLIGCALYLNDHCGQLFSELLIARLPSSIFGSLFIAALYWLGRAPFGRSVALAAALCLAFSPWLVYFSALAYLDMTMTTLITIAYLLLWPAMRRPQLYLLIAVLVALAVDSKYTAALAIPGMLLFTLYYFLAIRPRLPQDQQHAVPWRWWLFACLLCPLIFLAVDPAIWPDPVALLLRSFQYEWNHASDGHLTFLAGTASLHAPQWAIFYIAFAKVSGLVTLPAVFFALFAAIQLVRFHLPSSALHYQDATRYAFLLIWLLTTLAMFSRLDIVVGTHYFLPLAPSLALAGAAGLAILLHALAERCVINLFTRGRATTTPRFVVAQLIAPGGWLQAQLIARLRSGESSLEKEQLRSRESSLEKEQLRSGESSLEKEQLRSRESSLEKEHYGAYKRTTTTASPLKSKIVIAGLFVALTLPHLFGLVTIYGAEGYTSEFFQGENATIQVAYPGYRDAVQWLALHTDQPARIGLVGFENALGESDYGGSWYSYNRDLPRRLQLTEAHPDDSNFPYDYLVWPMHLIQRGYPIPAGWKQHVVHTITGGNTIYCYILARNISQPFFT